MSAVTLVLSAEQDSDQGHVVPESGSRGQCCVTLKSSIWLIEGVTIVCTGSSFKKTHFSQTVQVRLTHRDVGSKHIFDEEEAENSQAGLGVSVASLLCPTLRNPPAK